jgi:hypothetical protein
MRRETGEKYTNDFGRAHFKMSEISGRFIAHNHCGTAKNAWALRSCNREEGNFNRIVSCFLWMACFITLGKNAVRRTKNRSPVPKRGIDEKKVILKSARRR